MVANGLGAPCRRPLALRPEHIAAIYKLPAIPNDPFERALIAQATAEGLSLESGDAEIARYAAKGLRLVRQRDC
jgi:PIN domain nuclease of toxin-antitoxin system